MVLGWGAREGWRWGAGAVAGRHRWGSSGGPWRAPQPYSPTVFGHQPRYCGTAVAAREHIWRENSCAWYRGSFSWHLRARVRQAASFAVGGQVAVSPAMRLVWGGLATPSAAGEPIAIPIHSHHQEFGRRPGPIVVHRSHGITFTYGARSCAYMKEHVGGWGPPSCPCLATC